LNKFGLFSDIREAWFSIKNRWFQTFISTLGITISISSIFIMFSVSEGSKQQTLNDLKDFGIDTIRVYFDTKQAEEKKLLSLFQGISKDDIYKIKSFLPNKMKNIQLQTQKNTKVTFNNNIFYATTIVPNENLIEFENLFLQNGRSFLTKEITSTLPLAVVSKDIALKYKIKQNDKIIIKNSLFVVLGIVSTNKIYTNFIITNQERYLSKKRYEKDSIFLKIDNQNKLLDISDKIIAYFNNKPYPSLYRIKIPFLELKNYEKIQKTFKTALTSIAIMALLTGGIGIMNVMLSSISEQTRDIGLKLVVGASPLRLKQSYLVYSLTITLLGAVGGIFVGILIYLILKYFLGVSIIFSIIGLFGGFFISIVTGLISGIYPAIKASNIEPSSILKEY